MISNWMRARWRRLKMRKTRNTAEVPLMGYHEIVSLMNYHEIDDLVADSLAEGLMKLRIEIIEEKMESL